MIGQGSGVILALNSGSAHGSPMMGGTGPADATIDTFVRNLAAELGPHGVRVLGLWTAGVPETLSREKLAAANSALQRARATLRERLPARPSEWSGSQPTEEERALLERFIDAHERADAAAAATLAREDIRVTMPPHPWCYDGLASIAPLLQQGLSEPGDWRLVATSANRQPTAASYLRAPGASEFRAFKLDALRIEGGAIVEITTFDARLFPAFGLPPTL